MLMPQTLNGQEYMTAEEAARYLGISTRTFRNKYVNTAHPLFIRRLTQHVNPNDTRERLYLIADLDELKGIRPK